MNLNYLNYFRVLAKTEHVRKASDELFITQPNLSHTIHNLENDLGIVLFDRQGRNIKLNKYGKRLSEHVDMAFEILEQGIQETKDMASPNKGTIEIAFFDSLGTHFIPKLVKNFKSIPENKDFNVIMDQGSDLIIQEGVHTGKYDIIFCSAISDINPEIEYHCIAAQPMFVMVSLDHTLAAKDEVSISELNGEPFIALKSGLRTKIDEILENEGVSVDIVATALNGNSVAGLVSAGFGVTILPDIPLPPLSIKKLSIAEDIAPRYIYLGYNNKRYMTKAVQHFKKYVLDNYKI